MGVFSQSVDLPVTMEAMLGLCIVTMLGLLGWLLKASKDDWAAWNLTQEKHSDVLVKLLQDSTKVILQNTDAYRSLCDAHAKLDASITALNTNTQRLYEVMLERPCLAVNANDKK